MMILTRYRKHEVTIELMSKEEKPRVLKVTMGFKLTMGDFISTTYQVNLTVDPSSTSVRLEGSKEARKVLAEHLERMVEKSHRILAERGELETVAPVAKKENNVERPWREVAKKMGKKGEVATKAKRVAPSAPPNAPPSAPSPPASLPECPVCLQEMAPGDRIFQVSSSLVIDCNVIQILTAMAMLMFMA